MKLSELKDFPYSPSNNELSNMFSVEQTTNNDGSVSTFYNVNDGVVIDGLEDILPSSVKAYQAIEGDTLKLISWKVYGDIGYWWLIAKLNNIDDSFKKFEPGERVILLDISAMNNICNTITKGE